nr:Nucleolar protein 5A [Hymenolepis microstoma]
MASKQHFVLFENVTGYSLILVKEFNEIVCKFTAHVNSFLKPVAFVPFKSVPEALENVQYISEGRVSPLLSEFLRQNLPIKDAILGVAEQELGESILELGIGFECMWDSSIQEIIRVVRTNSSKLLRTLVVQPGGVKPSKASKATAVQETVPGKKAERRARLVVALARARLQLDLEQHLADTGVVRSLEFLDSMDSNLTKSVKHLCTSYAVHFPELCRNGVLVGVDDFAFASIVAHCPLRDDLVKEKERLLEWLGGNQELTDKIISLANSSTGQDLASDDIKVLQQYGQFLLKLLKSRTVCCELLDARVRSLVPNLTSLMDQTLPGQDKNEALERMRKVGDRVSPAIIAARLILHAGTLDKLARMTSSRVDSLGASRSLFRRGGAAAAAATGLLQRTVSFQASSQQQSQTETAISSLVTDIIEMSGGRLHPIVVRRKVARLLAAKSTLAVRADCYRRMDPFANGSLEVPERLESGDYGASLGEETKRQLRVWAEANGVHLERTAEELKKQREKRKKYRKAKRKKWLKRKLAGTSNPVQPTTNTVPAAVVSENGLSISGGSDVEQANIERPASPLLLGSKCAKSKESSDNESSTINNLSSSTICRSELHESKASDDNVNTEEEESFEVEPKGKSRKRRAQGGKTAKKSAKRAKISESPGQRVLRSSVRRKASLKQ